MSVAMGMSSGKFVLMISKSSSLETLLNMLVRSMKSAARVGVVSWCCGWMMWRSIESWMVLMMKSMPPATPTA